MEKEYECPNCDNILENIEYSRCPECGIPITFFYGGINVDLYRYDREGRTYKNWNP